MTGYTRREDVFVTAHYREIRENQIFSALYLSIISV